MIIGTPPLLPHLGHLNYQVLAFLLLLLLSVLVCHFRRVDVEIDAVFVNVIVIFVVDFNFTGIPTTGMPPFPRSSTPLLSTDISTLVHLQDQVCICNLQITYYLCCSFQKKPMPQYSNILGGALVGSSGKISFLSFIDKTHSFQF